MQGYRSCSGGGKERLLRGGRRGSWKSRSPTPLSMCQQGVQAGLVLLFSKSVELIQAQIRPNMGREEEVLKN